MVDEVRLKIAVDGTAEVVAEFERTSQGIGKAADLWQQNMRGVSAAMRATADASVELSGAAQKILDRYDPLGTKLRVLQSDFALLRREMGDNAAPAVAKAFQGLEDDIAKTSKLMSAAGVEGFESVAKAADKGALSTVGAKRELMVLAHEAMTGNFSRMPGSFMVLAERMSVTEALMSPLTIGLVGIGVAAVGVGVAMVQGAQEQKAMDSALIMTGNYAGLTSDSLNALAHSAVASGGSIGEAKKAVTELAASGKYTGEQIGIITNAAIAMEHATGQSIDKTIKEFETLAAQSTGHSDRMSTAISQATRKLDDQYHFLTLSVYDQIRALEKEGDMKGAAALATNEFAAVTKDRSEEILANVGSIGKAWNSVKEYIGGAIDRMNDWGKSATAASEVARLSGVVAGLQSGNYGATPGVYNEESRVAALNAATEQLTSAKRELFRANERAADQQAVVLTNQREVNAASAIDLMMKTAQAHGQSALTDALKKYHAELADLPPSDRRNDPAVVAAGEAALTKQYGEKAKAIQKLSDAWNTDAANLYASTMNGLAKAQESASAKADGLSKAQEALRVVQASPHWAQYNRQMQEQIIYAASLAQVDEDREAKKKLLLKAQADQNTADQKAADALHTEINGLRDGNAAMELHNQEIGLGTEALNALTLKRLDDQIAVQAGIVLDGERMVADGYVIASLQEQINKLDELRKKRGLLAYGQTATVAADESKKVQEEWKKASEQIGQSLTDQIMAGGKDGLEYLRNFARTIVLRPIVSAIMNPIGAVATGLMGTAGTAAAGGTAGTVGTGFLGGLSATAGGWGSGIANGLSAWGAEGSVSGMLTNASLYSTAEIVGALAPIGLGIMALVAISKATAGEMRSGGQYTYNPITGTQFAQGPSGGQINGAEVTTAISGTVESINRLLTSYGSASRLSGFVAGLESSGDNRGGVMAGGTLSTGGTFGQSGRGSVYDGTMYDPSKSFNMSAQEAAAAFALELQQSVVEAMQQSDLPAYLASVFNGLTANTMTADQITNTLAFASSLKQARDALLETREPLQILKDNVAAGFATLATSANTFKHDFVAAIDAGISPANLSSWQALATTMDQLAAATEAANTALATQQSAVLGAADKVTSVLRAIGNDVKAFADAAKTAQTNLLDSRAAISDALWAAQDRVTELQKQASDALRTFTSSIDDFLNTINPATGSNASLASLKAQLSSTAVLAAGGDTGAQGKLIEQAQAVLKAAEASSTDRVAYARSEAFVRSTLESVKASVSPALTAASAAIVDPLTEATSAVQAYVLLAQQSGAATDRSTRIAADSVVALTSAYNNAMVDNLNAQRNYNEALRVTAGLQLTTVGSFDSLVKDLADLNTANADLLATTKVLSITLGTPNAAADALAKSLGLAGTAVTNFVAMLTSALHLTTTVSPPATVAAASFKEMIYAGGADNTVATQRGLDYAKANNLTGDQTVALWNEALGTHFTIDDYKRATGSFAVGTNYVPYDMTANIHQGEEITPRPYVDQQRQSRDETNELLRQLVASNAELKAEVTALKKANEATQKATEKTADTLNIVTRGGRAIQTEVFT